MRFALFITAALCLAACAPSLATSRYALTPLAQPAPRVTTRPTLQSSSSQDNLTRLELDDIGGTTENAYSALERLRPLFLVPRPSAAIVHGETPRILVFLDGFFAGDVDVLKTIPVASVQSIRRVQSSMVMATMGEVQPGDMVLMVQVR